MKVFPILFLLIFSFSIVNSQSLPFDFESDITTTDFIDFDGGTAMVIDNPQNIGINTSSKVAQIMRDGGQVWAGSKINLDQNLDFTSLNIISMKVYTTAPAGTQVKMKLEGNGAAERDQFTTVSGEWEIITWDFTGTPTDFNDIVFMFDFGNVGDGSANSTFLFDDVEQIFGGTQIDLPVDFESSTVNYTLTDFEGNSSFLTTDPTDSNNTVIQAMKTPQASPSGGTTIGTNGGFATNIPLTLADSKMNVKVWSPAPGTPIRLKVEDSNDPTHTCETETNTTVSEGWEVLEFDFLNQAPGTELLSVGLDMGWTYNKASIFFNFGTNGASDNGQIYYFDDVKFGDIVLSNNNIQDLNISVSPNPSNDYWNIHTPTATIQKVEVYDLHGALVKSLISNNKTLRMDGSGMASGIYLCRISSESNISTIKIIKQ
jgi:hypothetical protein